MPHLQKMFILYYSTGYVQQWEKQVQVSKHAGTAEINVMIFAYVKFPHKSPLVLYTVSRHIFDYTQISLKVGQSH